MLDRRGFIAKLGGCSLAATAGCSIFAESHAKVNLRQLVEVRAPQNLGVTMGSITGSALQILVYAALTRRVPPAVISTFAGIFAIGAISKNLTSATNIYVDFRMNEAGEKLMDANSNIRSAMLRDVVDFNRLSNVVLEQGQALNSLRNSSETSLREFREFKSYLKTQMGVLREEESRSDGSSSVHEFAKDKLRTGNSEQDAITKHACTQVADAAGELKEYIRALQRAAL